MRPAYAKGLEDSEAVAKAVMPVERIACPLLLISGHTDEMWPSPQMAESIVQRRREAGKGDGDRHLSFVDAGHFFRPPITPTTVPWNETLVSGGTAVGNASASAKAWAAVLDFLRDSCIEGVRSASLWLLAGPHARAELGFTVLELEPLPKKLDSNPQASLARAPQNTWAYFSRSRRVTAGEAQDFTSRPRLPARVKQRRRIYARDNFRLPMLTL